jgi:hypothetical protein
VGKIYTRLRTNDIKVVNDVVIVVVLVVRHNAILIFRVILRV